MLIDRFMAEEPTWYAGQRVKILARVKSDQLMLAIKAGDAAALAVFLQAFWPFVREFPHIIARQCVRHAVKNIRAMPSWLTPIGVIEQLVTRIAEEGRHSGHWQAWAAHYGIQLPPKSDFMIPEVVQLLDHYRSAGAAEFAVALCATEILASGVGEMTRCMYPDEQWPGEHAEHFTPSHEDVDRQEAQWILEMEHADVESFFQNEMTKLADLFSAVTTASWKGV